eukprot:scaffold3001_cov122-Cylindrotheca_fusiformis.AAC.9
MDRGEWGEDGSENFLPTLAEGEEGTERTEDDGDDSHRAPARTTSLPSSVHSSLPFASPGTSRSFGKHAEGTPKADKVMLDFSMPMPLTSKSNESPPSVKSTPSATSKRKSSVEPIDEASLKQFTSPMPSLRSSGLFSSNSSNGAKSTGNTPKRSMSGDLDGMVVPSMSLSRPKPGVKRSLSLDADSTRPAQQQSQQQQQQQTPQSLPDSPADRLSSMILPGSLGARVSKRSQHFKSSIAQVSTNFFNRAAQEDDYVGDLVSREYPGESLFRGYSVGDSVLIFTNHRFVSSVNRFGFPPGQGRTTEEKTGPYLFVLGKIEEIHFEENSVFYTVRREDTGVDVRGNPGKDMSALFLGLSETASTSRILTTVVFCYR